MFNRKWFSDGTVQNAQCEEYAHKWRTCTKQNIVPISNESPSSLYSAQAIDLTVAMVTFTRTHTLVLVAVLVVLVLVGIGCWWRASAGSEAFVGAPRFNGRPTACRLHKVFVPTQDGEDPLLRLYVINRTSGKVQVAGPKLAQYLERANKAVHKYSHEEAVIACMRAPQFVGFVILATSDAAPEAPGTTVAGLQRYPTLFFEAGDAEEMQPINKSTYETGKKQLKQHVFQLYPRLDKCADTQFCMHPMVVADKVDVMGLREHTLNTKEPSKSIRAAKRYCTRMHHAGQNIAGFSCKRKEQDSIRFYEYTDEDKTDVDANLMKASDDNKLVGEDLDDTRVFYQCSDSACRATVADRDSVVQWRQWWKHRELGNDVRIHPMLAERDIQQRMCHDDVDNNKYDYNCFLTEKDTAVAKEYLQEHHGADATQALALAGPDGVESDPYKIYKDANNKLYFRQRDRCCENRIGHPGTIPHGASDVVHELVSAGCNTDLFANGDFFDPKCDQVCKERVSEDTPVYRRDLGRCVPEAHKYIPNRTVCNEPTLRAKFDKEGGTDKCSTMCGVNELDQDRGYMRLFHHPKSKGEGGEALETVATHARKTLGECRALCDAHPGGCDLFTISPCSTSSDKCMGECTLQRREGEGVDASSASTPLAVSNRRLKPRTRVYAKQTGDAHNDPHLKGFYERHNYCRMDGQPYYSYQFGGDYEDIFQTPKRLNDVQDALDQGLSVGAEPQPQPESSPLTVPQGILEGFAVSPIQKIHPQKQQMKMKGLGDVHIDRVYITAVPSFVSSDGESHRMKFVGKATPPSGLSLESTVTIGWNAPVDMATVQQLDWSTFFANVYQVEKASVRIEKVNEQMHAFHVSIPLKKDTANSTVATVSKTSKALMQSLKDKVTSFFANQQVTMPVVSGWSQRKLIVQKDEGIENVRVKSQSVEAMQYLQVTETGVHVTPETNGVQEEVDVMFDLPPVKRGKSMKIVATFTVRASDATEIDIFCGWPSHQYQMATSVPSGVYTFTVSAYKGQPVLQLEKQGEAEPLNVLQIPADYKGEEPPEINHLRAFEPDSHIYNYIHNLFQNSALGFKISQLTGEDSISDLTIRVQ